MRGEYINSRRGRKMGVEAEGNWVDYFSVNLDGRIKDAGRGQRGVDCDK